MAICNESTLNTHGCSRKNNYALLKIPYHFIILYGFLLDAILALELFFFIFKFPFLSTCQLESHSIKNYDDNQTAAVVLLLPVLQIQSQNSVRRRRFNGRVGTR